MQYINIAKWADYAITEVKFNNDRTHINYVKRYKDMGNNFDDLQTKTRQNIIYDIHDGVTYITAFKKKDKDGKYQGTKGSPVKVIEIDGAKYIKTESNNSKRDNLDNLPEFS